MSTIQQTFDGVEADQHEGEEQCPECGQWYEALGKHWTGGCSPPSLTEYQREIIKGSLLGDGCYETQNFRFEWCNNTTLPYLKWIKNKFGCLMGDICYARTPEESRISKVKSFGESYNCMGNFTVRTRHHPELSFCEKWGNREDTHFPDGLILTPTILKVWYVGDGSLNHGGDEFKHIKIRNSNQSHRVEYLKSLFEDIGFDVGVSSNEIRIPKSQTEQFFEYIGEPFTDSDAGFKYKWAHHDREEYDRLKNIHDSQPYLSEWSKDD